MFWIVTDILDVKFAVFSSEQFRFERRDRSTKCTAIRDISVFQ